MPLPFFGVARCFAPVAGKVIGGICHSPEFLFGTPTICKGDLAELPSRRLGRLGYPRLWCRTTTEDRHNREKQNFSFERSDDERGSYD